VAVLLADLCAAKGRDKLVLFSSFAFLNVGGYQDNTCGYHQTMMMRRRAVRGRQVVTQHRIMTPEYISCPIAHSEDSSNLAGINVGSLPDVGLQVVVSGTFSGAPHIQ